MTEQTHYEILRVKENATLEEIKAAYRKMVLILHPDKKAGRSKDIVSISANAAQADENEFTHIQLAWECLRDDGMRSKYDDDLQRKRQKRNLMYNKATLVHLHEMHREEVDCENDIGHFEDEICKDGQTVFECKSCTLAISICHEEAI
jgi:DnaJ-class molecular chaperone